MDYGWHDFVGNLGVACVLGSYLLLQTGRLSSEALSYGLLNAAGAVLIGVSLLFDFNLSSMIIEIAWFTISVFGILRVYRRGRTGS
ncbi:MAG: hypothetical protein V2I63_08985 [Pseudomonadales bacterium]|jgi:hypothetical protein|nr:hypothetical protein [Pseudomonadales bacterium]